MWRRKRKWRKEGQRHRKRVKRVERSRLLVGCNASRVIHMSAHSNRRTLAQSLAPLCVRSLAGSAACSFFCLLPSLFVRLHSPQFAVSVARSAVCSIARWLRSLLARPLAPQFARSLARSLPSARTNRKRNMGCRVALMSGMILSRKKEKHTIHNRVLKAADATQSLTVNNVG